MTSPNWELDSRVGQGYCPYEKGDQEYPYYSPNVHYGLWLDCLHRQDYERAYLETMGLVDSSLFWVPLARASTLGLLGRCEEGKKSTRKLLELRPDFHDNGRTLIQRYIKFDELCERVITGLNNVGLKIE